MTAAILLLSLAAFALVIWATYAAIAGRVPTRARVTYILALIVDAIAAYVLTFRYTYLANANTLVHGWPVPIVVFQRDGPNDPWLDFIGPTIVLAFPMNFVMVAIIPALLVLVSYYFHNRSPLSKILPAVNDGTLASARSVPDSGNPYEPPSTE